MPRIDHLPEQELAPLAPAPPNRRRAAWVALVAIGIGSATALLALPTIAGAGTGSASPGGRVLVCSSGVEQSGDIQMSSASATRVASGDTTPPPAGCVLR